MAGHERVCPRCGMRQREWRENGGQGYRTAPEQVFCCRGCAVGGECVCRRSGTARKAGQPVEANPA